jgi:hypothetical protein
MISSKLFDHGYKPKPLYLTECFTSGKHVEETDALSVSSGRSKPSFSMIQILWRFISVGSFLNFIRRDLFATLSPSKIHFR